MSLLSFVDLQERSPSPAFKKPVKAPRVLFDFVVERAHSERELSHGTNAVTRHHTTRPGALTCSCCTLGTGLMRCTTCMGMGGLSVCTTIFDERHPMLYDMAFRSEQTCVLDTTDSSHLVRDHVVRMDSAPAGVQRVHAHTGTHTHRAPAHSWGIYDLAILWCGDLSV